MLHSLHLKSNIDKSVVYDNEQYIKETLQMLLPKYRLKRGDLIIMSKIVSKNYEDEKQVTAAVQRLLDNLSTSYLYLYLMYWPEAGCIDAKCPKNSKFCNLEDL